MGGGFPNGTCIPDAGEGAGVGSIDLVAVSCACTPLPPAPLAQIALAVADEQLQPHIPEDLPADLQVGRGAEHRDRRRGGIPSCILLPPPPLTRLWAASPVSLIPTRLTPLSPGSGLHRLSV